MRVGIFSQTAGNPHRVERILTSLAEKDVSDVYFLGNLIGPYATNGDDSREVPVLEEEDRESITQFQEFYRRKVFKFLLGIRGMNEEHYLARRNGVINQDDDYAYFLKTFASRNYFCKENPEFSYGLTSDGFNLLERGLTPTPDLERSSDRLRRMLYSAKKIDNKTKLLFVGINRDRSLLRVTSETPLEECLEQRIYAQESRDLRLIDSKLTGVIVSPSSILTGYAVFDEKTNMVEFFD
jgi:hypothetical protein